MEKTYVAIIITNYGMGDSLNRGMLYISSGKLELCHQLPFDVAVKEMAKLAKVMGQAPKFTTNWYDPSISYRELRGYID